MTANALLEVGMKSSLARDRRWKPLADESETLSGISLSKSESKLLKFRGHLLLGRQDNSESLFQ